MLARGAVNDAPTGLKRVIQLFMYKRNDPDDNHYAHPLDFVPVADLNLKRVSLYPMNFSEGPSSARVKQFGGLYRPYIGS